LQKGKVAVAPFHRARRPACLLAAAALLAAAGCASKGDVSGKVTYKGRPLKGGTVIFTTPGKGSVPAPIAEDGSYTAAGVPAGAAKVAVETQSLAPAKPQGPMGFMKGPPKMKAPKESDLPEGAHGPMSGAPPKADTKRYVPIPEDYGDPDKSGLTLKVTGGPQTFNIDLK
jgi:hypothetical protein